MRNLLEYPITTEEIVSTLRDLARREAEKEIVGNLTPLILQAASEIVDAASQMIAGIDARLAERDSALRYVTPWKEATALVKALHQKD